MIYKHELVVYTERKEYFDPVGVVRDQSAYVAEWRSGVVSPVDMSGNARGHFDIPAPEQPYQSAFDWTSLPRWNRPKYVIGDAITKYEPYHKSDRRYYAEQVLRTWKRQGARKLYDFLHGADELQITIVAAEPHYCQPTYGIANQCYLTDGQSHGGLHWHYKVLITGLYEDRRIAAIPDVWIAESALHR